MSELQSKQEIVVRLTRRGLRPENRRVQYISEGLTGFLGILKEEPEQSFGEACHKGSVIPFRDMTDSEIADLSVEDAEIAAAETVQYIADLTPADTYLRSELEDGKIVGEAIHAYRSESSVKNLDEVLRLLRDSMVWVPGISAEDPLGLLGTKYSGSASGIRSSVVDASVCVPDLLQSADGGTWYFPVFTQEAVMGAYLTGYQRARMPLPEAVTMAENSQHPVAGILVNAFSESFFIDRQVFEFVKSLPSRIL